MPPTTEQQKEPDSPLAAYQDLWQNVPNSEENPGQPQELKPEDVQKVMSNADFSGVLTPEAMAAVTAGGEDSAQALATVMQGVAQQVMTQTTLINNKLTEKAVSEAIERTEAKLPTMLREQTSSAHLADSNPIFSNPAVKPIIDATKHQLLQKFPTATPAEITAMTNEYVIAVSEQFNPAAPDPSAPPVEDWSKFLESGQTN